jgi:hypothetical protein
MRPLVLYRRLLGRGRRLNYTEYTYFRHMVRKDFEKYRNIRDPKEIDFQLKVSCVRFELDLWFTQNAGL